MMRSLFSGVAGLKTHQTRMDVIGNNIANVNTTAYKSQSMVFNDLLYQTTQAASGANANTGRGGINPRQIGLGAKTGAISTAIATQGSAQSTNNPWDVMIEGDAFFVVSDGSQNFFTRDGSFTVDGAGNLVMASTGFTVMGWQVDPNTGEIQSDIVSALRVMRPENLTANPEATTLAYMSGILDKTDTNINSTQGLVRTLTFFDAQGYSYKAVFSVHGTGNEDVFRVQLDDILDSDGVSLVKKYNLSNINQIANFGSDGTSSVTSKFGMAQGVTYDQANNQFLIEQAMSSILKNYENNAMVVAAGKEATIKSINGTAVSGTTMPVATGDKVVVEGKITLTRAQLESAPYNLIYDDTKGLYYGKKLIANSNPKQYELGYIGGNEPEDPEDPDDVKDAQDANNAEWLAALSAMNGLDTVDSVNVTQGKDGVIEISFEATFDATQASVYDVQGNKFNTTLANTEDNIDQIKELVYNLKDGDGKRYGIDFIAPDGSAQVTMTETTRGNQIVFEHNTGNFSYIGSQGNNTAALSFSASAANLAGDLIDLSQFSNIDIDFSTIINWGNGGKCTLEMTNGSLANSALGAGRKVGDLIGLEIGQDGIITASYDNGLTKIVGQIAVAEFANASGLAKAGNNLYSATMNSGEFDGVGVDITANGGSMTSGVLEMSNVDLSSEFTTMITTQRGFQANSRIITVSDTLLEELVNLKR